MIYRLIRESEVPSQASSDIRIIDFVPSEMKNELMDFFRRSGTSPNRYYPEDKSDNQAIVRYLGKDEKNHSFRVAAIKDHKIIALLDAIPLDINEGQLKAIAAYAYGDPTDDTNVNQDMIQCLLQQAISNPDRSIQWLVFNDLSKSNNRRWIKELERFGFIQPYRFTNPTFKDTVVEVHVIRANVSGKYPITFESDVRNAEKNLPQDQGAMEILGSR